MKPTVQTRDRIVPVTVAQPGPHMNSLTHGLRSGHVLLPGDNVAAFRTLRHRLFHAHQPRTIAEARCVETIAVNDWRIARCRSEQRFFKQHLGAAMDGHPDVTGSLSNPDLHRLHHRGTDCHLEERRLERSTARAESTLALLQKERTHNLIPKLAALLEPYQVFLEEGEPAVEEEPAPHAARAEGGAGRSGEGNGPARSATGSADGKNRKFSKRKPRTPVTGFLPRRALDQRPAAVAPGTFAGAGQGEFS